jgi:AbrB family looped-hinge helix DNA binding protein
MVVPKEVREHLGVHPGDELDFIILDDGRFVVRAATLDVKQLKGILAKPGRKPVSIDQMHRAIRKGALRSMS